MSDYRIKVSISNGRILRLMEQAGIATQVELARRAGISMMKVNEIVKMRKLPKGSRGKWSDAVQRMASVLGVEPETMFSETQATATLAQNNFETDMSEADMGALCGGDVAGALEHKDILDRLMLALSDRQRVIVTERMTGATYHEIGADIGLCVERTRQIEAGAMRKMRYHAANLGLNHFLERAGL